MCVSIVHVCTHMASCAHMCFCVLGYTVCVHFHGEIVVKSSPHLGWCSGPVLKVLRLSVETDSSRISAPSFLQTPKPFGGEVWGEARVNGLSII